MSDTGRQQWFSSTLLRGLFLAFIWWSLSGGVAASWWLGVPAVVLALLVSILLLPPQRLVWHALFRFIPFFLIRSLLGGADVAWRAFHPQLPITPALLCYRLRLPAGLSRVVMVNCVTLLPGTLSAAVDGNVLQVHLLGGRENCLAELRQLEVRVAHIFDASLMGSDGVE
ncbi:MAG: Na+/H+ antiporter subunit E [Gammaproteobacteria bacterium]|nr:Na+/H+ antiporter subunit E [Gammaproteobacteria bacterium]MCF6229307.1 Na+/H+ antiporter subunit E [Gammaproteobacteria bacterium]